jgi:uncharacterized small protein (DUF1192 family)
MFEEDVIAQKQRTPEAALETLSVGELEARIAQLERELERCRSVIAAKRAHRSVADAVFGQAAG